MRQNPYLVQHYKEKMKRGVEFDRVKMHKDMVKDRFNNMQISVNEPNPSRIDHFNMRGKVRYVKRSVNPNDLDSRRSSTISATRKFRRPKTINGGLTAEQKKEREEKDARAFANL